jgi:hypothetical protein
MTINENVNLKTRCVIEQQTAAKQRHYRAVFYLFVVEKKTGNDFGKILNKHPNAHEFICMACQHDVCSAKS